jgi:hypothetical protein
MNCGPSGGRTKAVPWAATLAANNYTEEMGLDQICLIWMVVNIQEAALSFVLGWPWRGSVCFGVVQIGIIVADAAPSKQNLPDFH